MGLYLKTHNKKTDDEVLGQFGADGDEDSDNEAKGSKGTFKETGDAERFASTDSKSSPLSGILGLLGGVKVI